LARCLDDLGALVRGDRVRANLGDRRDVGEVRFRQRLRVAAPDLTPDPAGIDHRGVAALGDRHAVRLGVGDGPDDEAFDFRGKSRAAKGPGQTPSVFPRNKVFAWRDSCNVLLVR